MQLPDELVEQIARRAAELVTEREQTTATPWRNVTEAAERLRCGKDRIYDLIQLGNSPHVKVRRALVKGRMGPPKSKYGKRPILIDHELVIALREHRKRSEWPGEEHLVFAAGNGAALNPANLRRDALRVPRGGRT